MAVIPTGKYQFESNSQLATWVISSPLCCDSYRKVPIWKQFTTSGRWYLRSGWLWFLQESTNLKAIHNPHGRARPCRPAVIPTGKYQFESNSQLQDHLIVYIFAVIPTGKYQFESNSQRHLQRIPHSLLWFLQESTNLKAIHNACFVPSPRKRAVIPTGKYQFESNSQQAVQSFYARFCCDSYRKVPIWKQFTTS